MNFVINTVSLNLTIDLSDKKRKKLKNVIKQQLTGMLTRIEEVEGEGEDEEDSDY